MQETSLLVNFSYVLSIITTISFISLFLSEIADILKGNKAFFFVPRDQYRVKILRAILADDTLSKQAKIAATEELETITYRYITSGRGRK